MNEYLSTKGHFGVTFRDADWAQDREAGFQVYTVATGVDVLFERYETLRGAAAAAERAEGATDKDAAALVASVPTHTAVRSPIYGEGIRYADQAGATQYRGDSGRYNVQIWDES